MTPSEDEERKLALIEMIRDIDLTKSTLEGVVASLLFNLYKGDETKILKFIVLIKEAAKKGEL